MPRESTYGQPKKVTSVSMPDGLYEFFRRYSGRERNASGGISLAILTLVQKDDGAKYLMGQVIRDLAQVELDKDLPIPSDLEMLARGWGESGGKGQRDAMALRERGVAYEAQLKPPLEAKKIRTVDESELSNRVGAPLLFEKEVGKYMISLTQGEMSFLDKLGTGKRPRSQGLRFLAKRLWELDPDAANILCEIVREGQYFVPQLFIDTLNC